MNEKRLYYIRFSNYLIPSAYILLCSLSLISLFWIDSSKIGVVLLFTFSVLFTLEKIRKICYSKDLLSPLFIFITISFIAFPVKFLFYFIKPSEMFFEKLRAPINFNYSGYDFYITFLVFLLGYFSFILGYKRFGTRYKISTWSSKQAKKIIVVPNLNKLMFLCCLILFLEFYIKFKFGIGFLLIEPPKVGFRIVGITYFFFLCSRLFLITLYVYVSFIKRANSHILLSITILLFMAILEAIGLSKIGLIYGFFILVVVSLLLKEKRGRFPRAIPILAVCFILAWIVVFPVIEAYRFTPMMVERHVKFSNAQLLVQYIGHIPEYTSESLNRALTRISGFDQLLPIIAYGKDHALLNLSALSDSYNGGTLYKSDILGFHPEEPIGFAHTLWGVFYIHLGLVGVILGMFLWGKLNRLLYETTRKIYFRNNAYGAALWPLYLMWFLFNTFDGYLFYFGMRYFIAIVFVFLFWKNVLSSSFMRWTPLSGQ
jgi:hypothetical protein